MDNPVEIVLRGVADTGALKRYIAEEAEKLGRLCDRIQTCHVVAEVLHRPKQQGAQFAVQLNITLPGTELVVNREHSDDVYLALRDAFDAAGLQLKDQGRRQRNGKRRTRDGSPDVRS